MKHTCERLGTKQTLAGEIEWGWKRRAAGRGATQNQQDRKKKKKKEA